MTQTELNQIWKNICNEKYENFSIVPIRIPSENGKNIMSIPHSNGTARAVYERNGNGPWIEVPAIGKNPPKVKSQSLTQVDTNSQRR